MRFLQHGMLLLMLLPAGTAWGGGWDIGVSAEIVDTVDAPYFEEGPGFHLGYEFIDTEDVSLGLQLHYVNGNTREQDLLYDDEMTFTSTAVFATLRPRHWPLFVKLGRVHAEYTTLFERGEGSGLAWGAGLVFGDDYWRLHVLDYERYELDGVSFNTFSITVTVIFVP
ncbi:MAG TPA: hypothetical protein ENJ01_09935 [Gammaproteobacteria bacterium]|nr:hypothetical protein [Gammaproteobacteria bacterium]